MISIRWSDGIVVFHKKESKGEAVPHSGDGSLYGLNLFQGRLQIALKVCLWHQEFGIQARIEGLWFGGGRPKKCIVWVGML